MFHFLGHGFPCVAFLIRGFLPSLIDPCEVVLAAWTELQLILLAFTVVPCRCEKVETSHFAFALEFETEFY